MPGLFAVWLFSKVWNETVDEESNWNFSCAGGFLESSWYHAGIRSSWLCFITNQGSDYLVIILPPASLIAWVNTASACKLWVWPSTFATRDENPGVPGCAAPPAALPVSLGWCKEGMSRAGCAKGSEGAQCQLMDELFLTQMSRSHVSQPKSHVGRRWVLQGSSCTPWTALSVTSGQRLLLSALNRRKVMRFLVLRWLWGVRKSLFLSFEAEEEDRIFLAFVLKVVYFFLIYNIFFWLAEVCLAGWVEAYWLLLGRCYFLILKSTCTLFTIIFNTYYLC